MHDPRQLIENGKSTEGQFARRGFKLDLSELEALHQARLQALRELEALRAETRTLASGIHKESNTEQREKLLLQARELKHVLQEAETRMRQTESALHDVLLRIPNLPQNGTPEGDSEEFAVELRRSGALRELQFAPKDHIDLGEQLGILDFGAGVKLAGPRFAVLRGAGARLERALRNYLLDVATRNGYTEQSVPALVKRETMTGTGQLPKFEQDLFRTNTGERELFLIPTGEVPLTNLFAKTKIPKDELPIAVTADTPCFRSEAGSHGRDTRGLIRMHQFSKVELVRIVHPTDAPSEFERLVAQVEDVLSELELEYRVVDLAAGDLGFAAERTIDLEVWLPSQERFREISSVSTFGQFQARRANIRMTGDPAYRHPVTLNGSALPIGRTIAAILEQGQRHDGSVRLPGVLHDYVGATELK